MEIPQASARQKDLWNFLFLKHQIAAGFELP